MPWLNACRGGPSACNGSRSIARQDVCRGAKAAGAIAAEFALMYRSRSPVSLRAEARLVVAAVDVGILNLTNYKPPSPEDYYLGQQAFSAEIRDLYGQLIDGMQGARGLIRSGGDQGAELQGSPPTGPPVAFYSGLVTVGADGNAEVKFDIPDFEGTVRVMAVAWSKDKVGHATTDVTVRDPVVLSATLPRFLFPAITQVFISISTTSRVRQVITRSP